MVFPHTVITPQWVAWGRCGGMGQHGGCIFDHEASRRLRISGTLKTHRLILSPLVQTNIKEDDVLLHEMGNVIVQAVSFINSPSAPFFKWLSSS